MNQWRLIQKRMQGVTFNILDLQRNGASFCEYAESASGTWHVYFHGFPKREFATKSAAIRDAEKIAGHRLEIEYAA